MLIQYGYRPDNLVDSKEIAAEIPGWEKLANNLFEELERLGWDKVLIQYKEKFAGLRFYIGGGTDEIFNAIDAAEAASLRTCEVCGEPGGLTYDGWYRTLCNQHAEARSTVKVVEYDEDAEDEEVYLAETNIQESMEPIH